MWTFYKNLTSEDQGMVDIAAGGSIFDLTPVELEHMIRGLVSNIKCSEISRLSDEILAS